jgi:hypothetical protein
MIRKGIPAPLRCAVWISNIIQGSHPEQELKYAHEYRTLAKVRVLDHGYQVLWDNTIKVQDVQRVSFGNDSIWKTVEDYPGTASLENVLFALSHVLGGMDCAPLIPTIAAILLGFMSESYVFCAIREMAHHSTWYWASSQSEHVAYGNAFMDILGKLHQQTARTLSYEKERYTQAIFQDFFTTLLPEPFVLRIMDIYTLEGSKVLFRFGVALIVMYHREWKDKVAAKEAAKANGAIPAVVGSLDYWEGLVDFSQNRLNFELMVKKAYGVHGKGVRKRFRFPRRPIVARIIQLEEERYLAEKMQQQTGGDTMEEQHVTPLGLVAPIPTTDPDREPVAPKLAESTWVRRQLAEWLPVSLRYTKLDLLYSTNHHGRTLERLYSQVSKAKHTILILEPLTSGKPMVVGMYASQTWHPSTKVYGDGSCFLFRIVEDDPDETQCWKWHPTDINILEEEGNNATALLEQFQVGTRSYISMGGNKGGSSGLRLNEDLTEAESSPAPDLTICPWPWIRMFEVGLVEIYQIVRHMDGQWRSSSLI